jgi:hypothetical protein
MGSTIQDPFCLSRKSPPILPSIEKSRSKPTLLSNKKEIETPLTCTSKFIPLSKCDGADMEAQPFKFSTPFSPPKFSTPEGRAFF